MGPLETWDYLEVWQRMLEAGKDTLRTKTEVWSQSENGRNMAEGSQAEGGADSRTSTAHAPRPSHCSSRVALSAKKIQKGTQPHDILVASATEKARLLSL